MKTIKVTAPIEEQLIIQSFSEDILFEVDCKNSSMSNKDLLLYLNNLELNHTLLIEDLSQQQTADLVNCYMTLPIYCIEENLDVIVLQIMLYSKKLFEPDEKSAPFFEYFIETFSECVEKSKLFLDSIPILTYNSLCPTEKVELPIINDVHYIGLPLVNVLNSPDSIFYYSYIENCADFNYQFSQPIYNGKTIQQCIIKDNNLLPFFIYLIKRN